MNPNRSKLPALGIAVSSRGVGFAVMDSESILIDWGVKVVKGQKNERSLSNVAQLMERYSPRIVALEDPRSPGCRRSSRIHALIDEIVTMAKENNVKVKLFPRRELRRGFFHDGSGTKQEMAEQLAVRFPNELGTQMPRKRRLWTSQDYRMDIFDAVALAERSVLNRGNSAQRLQARTASASTDDQAQPPTQGPFA